MVFSDEVIRKVKGSDVRIVFPEAFEPRIKRAVEIIASKHIARPILLFKRDEEKYKVKGAESFTITDFTSLDDWIYDYYQERKKKYPNISIEEVKKQVMEPHYIGALLVKHRIADAMISGVTQEYKPFLPAFRVIGVKPSYSLASSFFLMEKDNKEFLFADCAVNINPSPEQLAEIALQTANTAIRLGMEPRVAMLSYSTYGSGKGEPADKVRKAVKIIRSRGTRLMIDGELQVDTALVEEVARIKAPDSSVAGKANVLIFPDLNAGNIGYKLVERLAGFNALGPVLQGLNAWISDLSRGASIDSIVRTTALISLLVRS
ncbi:phosphate acetyltransferase [Candidatus Woesearchaeota archaeon]|nr:phosphate acetyltransferase [Candidatus Woesearchaeota archaeon]